MSRRKAANPRREEQLDRIVLEMKTLDVEGNAARVVALRGQALAIAMELYDDGTEWFLQLLLELLDRFDAGQGEQFSHYFKFVLSRRRNDCYRDIANREEQLDSLDQPAYADSQETLGNAQAGPPADDPAWLLDMRAPFLEWTAMVLNFAERHRGQAANETRRNWYRIFYTEDITQAVKITTMEFLHERDVFTALKQTYLDYYMTKSCHSLREITETALKPYCEVVPEQTGCTEETPLPIPADVSLCYLQLVEGQTKGASRPARSNHKAAYDQEKEQIRKC